MKIPEKRGLSTKLLGTVIVVIVIIVIAVVITTMGGGGTTTTTPTSAISPTTTPSQTFTTSTHITTSPPPVLSGSLTVLASSGDPTLAPFLNMVASDFMAKYPGVKVQVQLVPFAQLVTTALTALKSQNPVPDVIIYYPSQAPTLGPYLVDVRKYLDSGVFNKSDIPFSTMLPVYLLDSKGNIVKIAGVPMQQVFGYVLVYQKHIFENQTLQAEFKSKYGFDFDPLKWTTWDQLIKAAEFIQSKQITKYALLFPDGLQQSIFNGYVGIFYSYAINDSCTEVPPNSVQGYWTYFKEVNGKVIPTLNCTAGIQALETYKKLVQFQPPIDVQAMEYDQLRDLFLTGDYAMGAAWTSFIPVYNNKSVSKVANDLGIAPLPAGATGQAPTFAGINPYSNNVDLAADFIAFMISPNEYKKGAETIGFVPATYSGLNIASQVPQTAWVAPFVKLIASQQVADLKRMAIVNNIQNFFTDLKPVFIQEVANYLRGKQTAEQTVNNIVSKWITLMKFSSS
jgi:multiple sugar transport system substrate-binding protein